MAVALTISEFKTSLEKSLPEAHWPATLQAMWYDAKGNWQKAHDIVEHMHTNMGSHIHAYLHRKEGDRFNAGYWYRQAGQPFPSVTLEEESWDIVAIIIANEP